MRWTTVVRAVIAVSALVVALLLVGSERARDRCDEATRGTFLASSAPDPALQRHVSEMIAECSGGEALTDIAVGLRLDRPRAAVRLAHAATDREPESYSAWAVLAIAAPPAEARSAARRARALNPLSASGAGP